MFLTVFTIEPSRAPMLLCRRRRAVSLWSAAARRRSQKLALAARRGVALAAQKLFLKDFRQNFVLSPKYSDDFFSHQNCNKISTRQQWHRRPAGKLSAAARRSTKVGGGAHILAAAAAHGSMSQLFLT